MSAERSKRKILLMVIFAAAAISFHPARAFPDGADYPPGDGPAPDVFSRVASAGVAADHEGADYLIVYDHSINDMKPSGVTYVELPNATVWQAIDLGNSSGVLVVHNEWGNAKVKDLNNGTFKGLIIADDIEKIHCTVLGAVVAMSPSPSGNCIGNGTGDVLFCREAIHVASSISAGGDGDVTVVSWWE